MMNSLITIQYFQGEEVVSATVPADELPVIARDTTFWRQDVLDADEMEQRGKALKEKTRERLFHNTILFPPAKCES